MTDDDKALMETIKDAVLHGTGFMKNGKHVPIDDVYLDPRDGIITAQAAKLEAVKAENERLRNALELIRDQYNVYYAKEIRAFARAALGETK